MFKHVHCEARAECFHVIFRIQSKRSILQVLIIPAFEFVREDDFTIPEDKAAVNLLLQDKRLVPFHQ